jgi:hypothetical protein
MSELGPSNHTVAAAASDERGDVAWHLVKNHVREGAELRADQHKSYDELVGLATMVRNDQLGLCGDGGRKHEPSRELLLPGPASRTRHLSPNGGQVSRLVRG